MLGGRFFSGSPPFFVCPKPGGGRESAITIRTQKQHGFVGECNPFIWHPSLLFACYQETYLLADWTNRAISSCVANQTPGRERMWRINLSSIATRDRWPMT